MKKLQEVFNWFVGKRTYLIAIVMAVLNLAVAAGWISPEYLGEINAVLVALGFGALRAGVSGK